MKKFLILLIAVIFAACTQTNKKPTNIELTNKFKGQKITQLLVGREIVMIKFSNETAILITNSDSTRTRMEEYDNFNGKTVLSIKTGTAAFIINFTDNTGLYFKKSKTFLIIDKKKKDEKKANN